MRRRLFWTGAGALVATVLAGGIAWAAIPSAGVIDGCYQKIEGQLRVIDSASASCRDSEIAITWNGQGVKGDKGEQGEPGRDGVDGTSVTVEQEAPGANCPAGGAKVTAANGVAYVCNAVPPDPGGDG